MTKKCAVWASFAIGLFVLQTSLLPMIAWRGISPDLLLLLTVSFGFLRGSRLGVLMGFCAGLLNDLATGTFFGVNVFNRMIIGFTCGKLTDKVFKEQFFLPIMSALAATVVNYFLTAAFVWMMGYRFNFFVHLHANLLPMLCFQLLFAYPVHRLTVKVDKYTRQE